MPLQISAIRSATKDHQLSCLAESTVGFLLRHLQSAKVEKTLVEELIEEHFAVDVDVINNRRTSADEKIRDFKLQSLYRMEVHWLLASRQKQAKFEADLLSHLRQISFKQSPSEMQGFLQECVLPVYVDRQPELLCALFDELNLSRPAELVSVFSPAKSVAPPPR